jgi:ribose transport system ATP-binding protein
LRLTFGDDGKSQPEVESATGNGAVVEIRGVSKRFPGVRALEDVTLDIRPGEVHAVAGENGAGKSTLMKLLSQLERPSDGTIEIGGKPVQFRNARYAQRLGSRDRQSLPQGGVRDR